MRENNMVNLSDLKLPLIGKDEEMNTSKMAMILDTMSKLNIKETPGILVSERKPFGDRDRLSRAQKVSETIRTWDIHYTHNVGNGLWDGNEIDTSKAKLDMTVRASYMPSKGVMVMYAQKSSLFNDTDSFILEGLNADYKIAIFPDTSTFALSNICTYDDTTKELQIHYTVLQYETVSRLNGQKLTFLIPVMDIEEKIVKLLCKYNIIPEEK